jgi:prophage regulatory protein
MESESLLRLPEVERRTGLRRAHLYKLARSGGFPRPLKIGARASAWRASEVCAWITERIAAASHASQAGPLSLQKVDMISPAPVCARQGE